MYSSYTMPHTPRPLYLLKNKEQHSILKKQIRFRILLRKYNNFANYFNFFVVF